MSWPEASFVMVLFVQRRTQEGLPRGNGLYGVSLPQNMPITAPTRDFRGIALRERVSPHNFIKSRRLPMAKPLAKRNLSDEALSLIAARFKVLSEPLRLKLIIALESGEKNVTELVRATGKLQANVSRQLQLLVEAGILGRQRQGACVYYHIADPAIFELCRHVCGSLQREFLEKGKASKMFVV